MLLCVGMCVCLHHHNVWFSVCSAGPQCDNRAECGGWRRGSSPRIHYTGGDHAAGLS